MKHAIKIRGILLSRPANLLRRECFSGFYSLLQLSRPLVYSVFFNIFQKITFLHVEIDFYDDFSLIKHACTVCGALSTVFMISNL